MGRCFSLAVRCQRTNKTVKKPKNKKNSNPAYNKLRENWGSITLSSLLIGLIIVVGALYLFEVNTISTKGYEIRELEQQVAGLKDMNQRLQLEATSLQTIQNVDEEISSLNLIPSGSVNYLGDSEYAFEGN